MLLLARPPTCVRVKMRVRVCQCVCLGQCPGMRVTRAHTADVLADFCDGDVAPRSRNMRMITCVPACLRQSKKTSRVRIRMRVRLRSCVRESLCLHSHMYAHA